MTITLGLVILATEAILFTRGQVVAAVVLAGLALPAVLLAIRRERRA